MPDFCVPDGIVWETDPIDEQEDARRVIAEQFAWSTLQQLTGYRIGLCSVTVRPSPYERDVLRWMAYGTMITPTLSLLRTGERWCATGGDRSRLDLPGPVGRVDAVKVDGVPVMDWAIFDNAVIRLGDELWPSRNDLSLPDTEIGTWSVTYLRGHAPDSMVIYAAGVLAREYIKAVSGTKGCRLPKGVRQITRAGATYEVMADLWENGRTEIEEVDVVIRRFNPYKLKTAPVVMSPDTLPPVVQR
jgi:hypothetical protein